MKIVLFQFYSPHAMPDYTEIGKHLERKGHNILVTYMSSDRELVIRNNGTVHNENIYPILLAERIKIKVLRRRLVNIVLIFRIRRWILKIKPEIFMINPSELMYLSILTLFMPSNVKFVLDIRQLGLFTGSGFKIRLKNIRAKLRFLIFQKFFYDTTCFASEEAARFICGKNWQERKVTIKKVGVDECFFNYVIPGKKRDGILRLVYIGSLARVRKLEFLIDAIKLVLQKSDKVHLTFVGPLSDNYLSEYVYKQELSSLITIQKPVAYNLIPEILHQHDIAVAYVPDHPDWKYQPTLKVLEYCAAGMPVLASENFYNRKIINENVTGIFFENTIPSLKEAILKFITDKFLLDRITYGAAHHRTGLNWDESAQDYEDLFLSF
jgi:glycosyltransferase involved in cell wall biosynthesis